MTQLAEHKVASAPSDTPPPSDTDLMAAVRRVLEASPEPLTLSKIRSALPASFRSLSLEALAEALQRQVAANVLVQYPKYRSPQDRFWDRPMRVHVAYLLQVALAEQPLATSELRRKLPDYAKSQADAILEEEVTQGRIHRHPPTSSRSGPRFGVQPPDPRSFLSTELSTLFGRLEKLGFTPSQLREAAIDLLRDEEWAPTPPGEESRPVRSQGEEQAPTPAATQAAANPTTSQQAPPARTSVDSHHPQHQPS